MSNINGWARLIKWVAAAAASALVLGACGSIRQAGSPAIESKDSVAVVTMANFTETPAAGSSAAAIAANALRQNGFADVRLAPVDASANAMFDTAQRDIGEKKLAWAREQRVKYVLTGAVEEWRYKVGVDGEPAVGLTFDVIDVQTGKVVWTGTGSRTGWSRDAVSGVAQKLERDLLSPLAR